jgi:M6 family metalloprotease-like protein
MRIRFLKTVTFIAVLLVSIACFSIPANKTPITIKQPNGKTLTFVLQGDEFVHWAKTLDGYSILPNKNGNYVYAIINNENDLVPSTVLAANSEERSRDDENFLLTIRKDLRYSPKQVSIFKECFAQTTNLKSTLGRKYPTTGTVRLLVILVNFSDLSFTYTNQNFTNLVSQHNYNGVGSVKDYYSQNSDSIFNMQIDVVGPYTLSNTMAYYGGDSPYQDHNIAYFVSHSINAADPYVNYADYDNDGDGVVDAIHIIFAGTPQSSTGNTNEIWPHRSNVSSSIVKDGVRFSAYSCSAEKKSSTQMDGIGTVCHEFGHVLGFPDYYDTDYSGSGGTSNTLSSWDLMDEGSYNNNSNTPPALSAAEKTITHWMTPIVLSAPQDSLLLPAITDSNIAYQINLSDTNEYFLVEHRKKKGWDFYIPGNGMMIYHGNKNKINAWLTSGDNTINVNPSSRGWYIEPADGVESHYNTSYAPFPGSGNITCFTNNSANNATLNNGNPANRPITNIHYVNDSLIMFNFESNYGQVQTNTVTTSTITTTSFAATGTILYKGNGTLTQKGIMYSLSPNCPTDSSTMVVDNSTDTVNISASITGLSPNTTYYYRAYMTNTYGSSYGSIFSITTNNGLGYSLTSTASNIDTNSATLEGNLYFIGEGSFIEKGFVLTTTQDYSPTVTNDTKVSSTDSTLGAYSLNVNNLTEGTNYYFRAFITNSYGTFYGTKKSFRTLAPAILNNTIASSQAFCLGSTPNLLTGSLPTGGHGNFTYKWQQKARSGQWFTATQADSTNQSYQPEALTDSTYFRRIVVSNGTILDTSNTVLLDVQISRGGNLVFAYDTVSQHTSGTFSLNSYRGSIKEWELSTDNSSFSAISSTTTSTYSPTFNDTGNFYYRVMVQISTCPAAYSNVKKVTVIHNSSIEEVSNDYNISISPNPTVNGSFTISSNLDKAERITISNLLGQRVYVENNVNLTSKTISLPNANNGTYILTINNGGKQISKKLIINK